MCDKVGSRLLWSSGKSPLCQMLAHQGWGISTPGCSHPAKGRWRFGVSTLEKGLGEQGPGGRGMTGGMGMAVDAVSSSVTCPSWQSVLVIWVGKQRPLGWPHPGPAVCLTSDPMSRTAVLAPPQLILPEERSPLYAASCEKSLVRGGFRIYQCLGRDPPKVGPKCCT